MGTIIIIVLQRQRVVDLHYDTKMLLSARFLPPRMGRWMPKFNRMYSNEKGNPR